MHRDSVELTIRGHAYDALVGLAAATSPAGMMMAMVRLKCVDLIYGGRSFGQFRGQKVTVQDMSRRSASIGRRDVGCDLDEIERVACRQPARAAHNSPPIQWRRYTRR